MASSAGGMGGEPRSEMSAFEIRYLKSEISDLRIGASVVIAEIHFLSGLHSPQLVHERSGALDLLVRGARRFGQMPLTFDVGVLKLIGPGAKLAGDGFARRDEI